MTDAESAEHAKPLKCFCGKDMQYDKETGVWGCTDSVYVPPDAHFEDVEQRQLTHPALILGFALIAIGIACIFLIPFGVFSSTFVVPIGLAAYCLGYWNRYMLFIEAGEQVN